VIETIAETWDALLNGSSIWAQLTVAALIFILALLVRNIFTRCIFRVVLKYTRRTKTDVDSALVLAFERPARSLIVIIGLFLALNVLPLPSAAVEIIINIFRSLIIIFISWGFYNLLGGSAFRELSDKVDVEQSITDFMGKVIRFIIIALAVSIVAQEWDYDVTGFIAGIGLGGLAFALAAQDTARNVFGGIVIILDKPFDCGDWILTPSVEGTVEEISFRSTKVRTFANALVTVPNSVLADEAVTNWTRMKKRQITFHVGVTYTTPRDKLQSCVERIKGYLREHPEVHPDTIFVRFDRFSDSSLDIFLYFFTRTTVWGEFLAVKEEINFKIMEILEEEGVSIAFPSRSLYFENRLETGPGPDSLPEQAGEEVKEQEG